MRSEEETLKEDIEMLLRYLEDVPGTLPEMDPVRLIEGLDIAFEAEEEAKECMHEAMLHMVAAMIQLGGAVWLQDKIIDEMNLRDAGGARAWP